MERWFNLVIQVAKPILTTLAQTGTNIFLDTVQSEIANQQNKKAQPALKSSQSIDVYSSATKQDLLLQLSQ